MVPRLRPGGKRHRARRQRYRLPRRSIVCHNHFAADGNRVRIQHEHLFRDTVPLMIWRSSWLSRKPPLPSRAAVTQSVGDALFPIGILVVGLISFQRLMDGLGEAFGRYYQTLPPDVIQYPIDDALLQTQLVFGVFFVTNVVAIAALIYSLYAIGRLRAPFAARAMWSGVVLSVTLSAILLGSGPMVTGPPLWKTMANQLFEATVLRSLRDYSLTGLLTSSPDTLNACVLASNIVFAVASSFILYAVAGLRRAFLGLPRSVPADATDPGDHRSNPQTQQVLSYIYRLRTTLVIAAAVMVSGVANMICWRYWPLAYISKAQHGLASVYAGLAEGSVIYQAATFTLILVAIFLRPFLDLNEHINTNPRLRERVRRDGVINRLFAWTWDILLHLSPLGLGLAATLLSSHIQP